ncbi:HEPN domain-containing protein [Rossellomorea vietnamensis]|uniref:HEPN domain-containing protein n=1 Tax=Rossellomorea vietnamensis TaxID=218284 RepID=UPI0005551EE1|nr:HEPN domain-containing protein [Rossellomorea vietnamensis]
MKAISEVVKIIFEDKETIGYLVIKENERFLEFLNEDLGADHSIFDEKTLKDFHCKRTNGITVSCFKCRLTSTTNGNLIRFRIGVYVEDYIKDFKSLNFKSISSIFPKLDAWFVGEGENLNYCSEIFYKNQNIIIEVSQGRQTHHHLHGSSDETYLTISMQSDEDITLDFANELFYKISVVFSFLCNSFITYSHNLYENNEGFPIKILQSNMVEENIINFRKLNYRPKKVLTHEEFNDIFIKPLSSGIFDVWMNFVGVLRSKPLIEEQFLVYARCLEIISRHYVEGEIYTKQERKAKSQVYNNVISNMALSQEYKENLKEAFKFSNKRSFKMVLNDLIDKYPFKTELDNLDTENTVLDLIRNIVNIRNHFTHGLPYDKINYQSLFFYKEITRKIVISILLNEHRISNESLKIGELMEKYKKVPNAFL